MSDQNTKTFPSTTTLTRQSDGRVTVTSYIDITPTFGLKFTLENHEMHPLAAEAAFGDADKVEEILSDPSQTTVVDHHCEVVDEPAPVPSPALTSSPSPRATASKIRDDLPFPMLLMFAVALLEASTLTRDITQDLLKRKQKEWATAPQTNPLTVQQERSRLLLTKLVEHNVAVPPFFERFLDLISTQVDSQAPGDVSWLPAALRNLFLILTETEHISSIQMRDGMLVLTDEQVESAILHYTEVASRFPQATALLDDLELRLRAQAGTLS